MFEKAWRFLKASRQMKLYNYIEDYPGMNPVSGYRGVPLMSTAPQSQENWSQKPDSFIDLSGKGTWWADKKTVEPHATASFFANANFHDVEGTPTVLGLRGPMENYGRVQRRRGWNPTNERLLSEALITHDKPIDWENIVFSQPSESVTTGMTEEEEEAWAKQQFGWA
tara:strand:- start:2337 stop:2840 length:504 start_codon:yes stop_codon:yes gene_type:complete